MLEASNLKTMESWYQNLSPYVNDKEFPLRGGKKDLPPVLIGLSKYLKGEIQIIVFLLCKAYKKENSWENFHSKRIGLESTYKEKR